MGPDITISAIIIFLTTLGVSLYTMYKNQRLYWQMALNPYLVYYYKKYYKMLTSGFVHADMGHLLFNMITFYFFAFQLEGKIGAFSFILIYLGSMVLSNISTVIKHKDNPDYHSVGASGAISGILFSSILYFPDMKLLIFPIPIPIPSPIFAILYLVYSHFAAKRSGDNINHDAHLWGAFAGVVLTLILNPEALQIFIYSII